MTRDRFARIILVLAVCAGAAACGKDNQYAAPPPPKVTVAVPVEQDVTRYFEATGNTAAVNSIDLVARVQGFVQAISYKDGDYVKKGTSLFTIEPEPYKLKVESAKAAVVSAQATLTQTQAEYALAAAPSARVHRAHHTWLLAMFGAGLAAISVALVLTALTEEPDTTPVPRCHDGGCPGLPEAGQAIAGTPEPPPYGTWHSRDGRFSLGLFIPSMFGQPQVSQNSSALSFTFKADTFDHVHLGGGTILIGDVTASSGAGASAQQVVNSIVSKDMPSASLAYELPDALVGTVSGYGGVYNDNINSSSGTQEDYRVMVMAAVHNGARGGRDGCWT